MALKAQRFNSRTSVKCGYCKKEVKDDDCLQLVVNRVNFGFTGYVCKTFKMMLNGWNRNEIVCGSAIIALNRMTMSSILECFLKLPGNLFQVLYTIMLKMLLTKAYPLTAILPHVVLMFKK